MYRRVTSSLFPPDYRQCNYFPSWKMFVLFLSEEELLPDLGCSGRAPAAGGRGFIRRRRGAGDFPQGTDERNL